MKESKDLTRIPLTGSGLVFGTAIGAGLSLGITGNVLWVGIGTVVGLLLGAIIDSYTKKNHKE